jgi:hypothetical protein
MGITPNTQVLRRYTDLPALLYLLQHRKITLLDPASWDDKNDSYYLQRYKEKKDLKTVLALCLTSADETYHHWRIFSHGASGVCITFDRRLLTQAIEKEQGASIRDVVYRKMRVDGRQIPPPQIAELPFVKRAAFDAEEEVRVLYESSTKVKPFLDIPIELAAVLRVTLSPWIHPRLKTPIINAVKSVEGCAQLTVRRSSLVGNAEWKKLGDKAA